MIVVKESLKLPRGKLVAQVAQVSVATFLEADEAAQQSWVSSGMAKIVLERVS